MLPHQLKLKWHPADQLPARWQIWLVAPAGQPAATHRSSLSEPADPLSSPPWQSVILSRSCRASTGYGCYSFSSSVCRCVAAGSTTKLDGQSVTTVSQCEPPYVRIKFLWLSSLSLSLEPFLGDVAGLCSTNLSIYVVATVAVRHCDSANSSFIRPIGAGAREMDNDAIVSLPRIGCPVSSHNWRFFLETFKI